MDSFDNIREQLSAKYNEEPVVYCTHCLSLAIRILDDNIDYCDLCGSTDTASIDVRLWEDMYKDKYGNKYLNRK